MTLIGEWGGTPVHEIPLKSPSGAEARILSWGAVLRDLKVPHRGGLQRVVLGLERAEDNPAHSPHMGAIAGRYANRIANGRFELDGREVQLPTNFLGKHALHGGPAAFGKRPWQVAWTAPDAVALTLYSSDGDGFYPGALTATCVYRLLDPAILRIELTATTDAPTIVNLAHHSYFNLDGAPDILGHTLQLAAPFYTPVDDELIPTGEILSVADTPFDFRMARRVGDAGRTFDHNFVVGSKPGTLRFAARLASPQNGLAMEVHTTEPGVQFYDGAKVSPAVPGLGGVRYGAHAGLCLEPQRFPDSPNRPHFSPCVLRPGEVYRQISEFRFGEA